MISRRKLLLGAASTATLALAVPLFADARETIGVEAFRALSARLTGAPLTDLDAAIAGQLLRGFISLGQEPELERLAATDAAGTLADDIVAAWYSGTYATAEGPAAFDLTRALLWDALDFTKAPGLCVGTTGDWADAPQR
jgi:hypothetical protein